MKYGIIKSNALDIKRYISFRIIEEDRRIMKIEIEFDGSTAKTLINGKPIHICSDMEHNFMFNAFECIRKDIERERNYGRKKECWRYEATSCRSVRNENRQMFS